MCPACLAAIAFAAAKIVSAGGVAAAVITKAGRRKEMRKEKSYDNKQR